MNIELSLIVSHKAPIGVNPTLAHYRVSICASLGSVYGFSSYAPLSEVPAHLLADPSFEALVSDPFMSPLVIEANDALKSKLKDVVAILEGAA